jgi:hypothetical protein
MEPSTVHNSKSTIFIGRRKARHNVVRPDPVRGANLRYAIAAIPEAHESDRQGRTDRKTGVKRAEVITARLVQYERGWLRLTG